MQLSLWIGWSPCPRRRALGTLVLVALVGSSSGIGRADDEAARALVKGVLDTVPKVSLTAQATLTSDRGWTRELALSRAFVGDTDASYLEVTAPFDLKDTRFLLLDRAAGRDEQFMYVPTVRRALQVSEETRKQPFLGSDFYVSDMVRPQLDGFTYRFVGEERVGERQTKLVESIPKNAEGELYAKTISAIDPADLLMLRVQFFDAKGKLIKVWTLEKVEKIEGFWTPMVQRMASVPEGHESRLTLTEVKYGVELPADTFSRTHLGR